MKLAYNKLFFEKANTNLLSLTAQVSISPLSQTNYEAIPTTLFAEPNEANKFVFFVKNMLQGHRLLTPEKPLLTRKTPFLVSNHLAKVKLTYQFNPTVSSEEIEIMGGGSSSDNALTDAISNRKFLTNQPLRKKVDKSFRDFLYYLCTPEQQITSLNLEYEIFYDDGSTKVVVGGSVLSFTGTETVCFPTGYYAIAEHENEDTEIKQWTVRLMNQSNKAVSERRIYALAPEQDYPTSYLMLRNSFNVFDCLYFDGTTAEFFDSESQLATNDDNLFELNNEGFTRININTGRLLTGWINYLKELMLSGEIYLLRNNSLVKIVKQNNKLTMIDISKNYDSTTLEFRLAKTDYHF